MEETEIQKELTTQQQIFEIYPVPKAVAVMVFPTIVSQIITVLYNLADTWFVGLTGNAAAVAAISLCMPVYCIMTALANLFGIGGASVIARAIGCNQTERATKVFSTAVWSALVAAISYSVILFLLGKPFLMMIGGDESSIGYAVTYTRITIVIGSIPTVLSAVFAHLIRSMGHSKAASYGITLGAVLNMVLDPLFMFVLLPPGNEVLGAAVATAISNVVAMGYFVVLILKNKNPIFNLKPIREGNAVLPDIIRCGIPSLFLLAAPQISNFFLNSMIADMGSSAAVAGIGVVRKIDSLAYAVNQGITQGMLPIVAYCYASSRHKRLKAVVGFSSVCTLLFSLLCSICSYIFASQLISFFIRDAETIYYGVKFLRVLCIAVAIYPMLFVIIAVFQAVGQSFKPFILSLLNKGSIDILLLFAVRKYLGLEYILWVAPFMSAVALIVAIILCLQLFRQFQRTE